MEVFRTREASYQVTGNKTSATQPAKHHQYKKHNLFLHTLTTCTQNNDSDLCMYYGEHVHDTYMYVDVSESSMYTYRSWTPILILGNQYVYMCVCACDQRSKILHQG